MSITAQNATLQNAKSKEKPSQSNPFGMNSDKLIAIVCHVYPDGIGDLMHLATKANPAYLKSLPIFEGYDFVYLISYFRYVPGMHEKVNAILNEYSIESPFLMKLLNPATALTEFQQNMQNSGLIPLLKQCRAIINFSTASMELFLEKSAGISNKGPIPFVSIGEICAATYIKNRNSKYHGKQDDSLTADKQHRHMGASINHYGFFINPPKEKLTSAQALSKINDSQFITALFGNKTIKTNEMHCQEFLKNKLLVPCYFQDGSVISVTIMQGLITSLYVKENNIKEIIFVVNDDNFNPNLISKKYFTYLKDSKVGKILYTNGKTNKTETITFSNESDAEINVKILEGFWLNQRNYEYLAQAATGFYGCSGDNTLEKALSNPTLIPLFQCRQFKKNAISDLIGLAIRHLGSTSFCYLFLNQLKGTMLLKDSSSTNEMVMATIVSGLSATIRSSLFEEWSKLIKIIHEKYNFAAILPLIYTQAIKRWELNEAVTKRDKEKAGKLQNEIAALENEINKSQMEEFNEFLRQVPKGYPVQGNRVNLGNIRLNAQKFTQFLTILADAKQITSLNLKRNSICLNQNWTQFVNFLVKNPRFTHLNLRGCDLTEEMIIQFSNAVTQIKFENLSFHTNPISPAALQSILELLKHKEGSMHSLRYLDLSACDLSDKHIQLLVAALLQSKEMGRNLKLKLNINLNPRISQSSFTNLQPLVNSNLLELEIDHLHSKLTNLKQPDVKTDNNVSSEDIKNYSEKLSNTMLLNPMQLLDELNMLNLNSLNDLDSLDISDLAPGGKLSKLGKFLEFAKLSERPAKPKAPIIFSMEPDLNKSTLGQVPTTASAHAPTNASTDASANASANSKLNKTTNGSQ